MPIVPSATWAEVRTGKFCKLFAPLSASLPSLAVTPSAPRSMPSPVFAWIEFPRIRLPAPAPAWSQMPSPPLKAMTLPSFAPVPPIVLLAAPPYTSMPAPELPSDPLPVAVVPMLLPRITAPLAEL